MKIKVTTVDGGASGSSEPYGEDIGGYAEELIIDDKVVAVFANDRYEWYEAIVKRAIEESPPGTQIEFLWSEGWLDDFKWAENDTRSYIAIGVTITREEYIAMATDQNSGLLETGRDCVG
jgi:hypothetical protein